jgi:hypothetical protein
MVVENRQRFVPTLAIDWPYEWCMRCRRPSLFVGCSRHHALPGMWLDASVARCFYCGIRQEFGR